MDISALYISRGEEERCDYKPHYPGNTATKKEEDGKR